MRLALLKRWPGWLLILGVTVALMLVGTLRDQGTRSEGDRIDSISKRVACPVCDGESVFESRNAASTNIGNKISDLVREGKLSDNEIIAAIQKDSAAQLLLVPRRSGFDALVWALPVAAGTVAFVGLGIAFRRWTRRTDDIPTDDDRALVDAARSAGESGEQ